MYKTDFYGIWKSLLQASNERYAFFETCLRTDISSKTVTKRNYLEHAANASKYAFHVDNSACRLESIKNWVTFK